MLPAPRVTDRAAPGGEPPKVLVIDDDPAILRGLELALANSGLRPVRAASCGEARLALLGQPDVAVILCDHLLPDGTGVEFLREIKHEYPLAVRLIMTGAHVFDRSIALQAINAGEIYRFLPKPFSNEELLAAIMQSLDRHRLMSENAHLQEKLSEQNRALQETNANLAEQVQVEESVSRGLRRETVHWRRAFHDSVDLCLQIMRRIDEPLHEHGQRVAATAAAIGRDLGLDGESVGKLELAGSLHDLGLLGAGTNLQRLQRRLDQVSEPADRDLLAGHPRVAAEILSFLPQPDVIEAISQHHERADGTGYPEGTARLSRLAHILAVADAYDEAAPDHASAVEILRSSAGRAYAADVVDCLVRLHASGRLVARQERAVSLPDLLPGMRLASPIYTATGALLARRGQVVNETLIRRLLQQSARNALGGGIFVEV